MSQWTEQRPDETFYRVLTPKGELEDDPPNLEDETLMRMYRTFIQTRVFETKILRMQRRGEISIIARTLGEEAIALGTAAALESGDWYFPTYRQTSGLFYWKTPMDRSIAGMMGAEPETVNEHLAVDENDAPEINITPGYVPLTVNIPNAVGSSLVDKLNGNSTVTMTYIGDGATSEGDFYEGLNFAGVFDVPSVIICQNNQWAISVPSHRQTAAETFAQKADACGVPFDRLDGNDVLGIYKKTKEAVERARARDGPTFIECVTYRMGEHNTSDEESVYRTDEEREYWKDKDPVDRFEIHLREKGLLNDDLIEDIENDAEERVQEAVERARSVPVSKPQRMFDNHLHGQSWQERHQRAELKAELDGRNPFTDFTGEGLE